MYDHIQINISKAATLTECGFRQCRLACKTFAGNHLRWLIRNCYRVLLYDDFKSCLKNMMKK